MSQQNTYPIRCPKCQQEQEVELYESINVQTDPGLREAFMGNRLNAVTCAGCGFSFRVDKNLLYVDPARHFMIYWMPSAEEEYDRDEGKFVDLLSDLHRLLPADVQAPQVHLVFSRAELVERIFLLEAGLDERIIEYIKYTMYTRNSERLDPEAKALLFSAGDSTEKHLCFVVQDLATRRLEAVMQYERQAYAALKEMFADSEKSVDLLELFPGPYICARANLLRELETEEDDEDAGTP